MGGSEAMPNSQLMERCIDECLEVVKLGSHCSNHCLESDQVAEMRNCVRLCLDSVDIVAACARMMGRDSQYSAAVCRTCAEVCDACAGECEKFQDEIMKQCAEACRRCAETCRQMAA
jgi:hypothetical protein